MKKIFNKILLIVSLFSLSLFNFSTSIFAVTYQVDEFVANTQVSKANAGDTFGKIITITFVIAAFLAFSYLIYGAISIITSNGEASKKAAGRERITYAAIGLLILAATWGMFSLVMNAAFNSDSLTLPKLDGSTPTN